MRKPTLSNNNSHGDAAAAAYALGQMLQAIHLGIWDRRQKDSVAATSARVQHRLAWAFLNNWAAKRADDVVPTMEQYHLIHDHLRNG